MFEIKKIPGKAKLVEVYVVESYTKITKMNIKKQNDSIHTNTLRKRDCVKARGSFIVAHPRKKNILFVIRKINQQNIIKKILDFSNVCKY